jgi:hypothetical protein
MLRSDVAELVIADFREEMDTKGKRAEKPEEKNTEKS